MNQRICAACKSAKSLTVVLLYYPAFSWHRGATIRNGKATNQDPMKRTSQRALFVFHRKHFAKNILEGCYGRSHRSILP